MNENNNIQRPKSKVEVNLTEFPLGPFKRMSRGVDVYRYDDFIIGESGRFVQRRWSIYRDVRYGFGSSTILDTVFDLFQIWKEQRFSTQYVYFGSIYNLVKRRGLSRDQRAYDRIKRDLKCLVGMKIEAENAFWDAQSETYVNATFHYFDELIQYKDKEKKASALPILSMIKASDILYESVKHNGIIIADFDTEFFHSLTPTEKRLALYLSKVLRSQKWHQREILKFAEQIPLQSQKKSHIKEQLKDACESLIGKGFKLLASYEFQKTDDEKNDLIVFVRAEDSSPKKLEKENAYQKENYLIEALTDDIMEICGDEQSKQFYRKAARLLPEQDIYQAISEVRQVRDFVGIRKSTGALFTSIIKKLARQRGVDL
jgi:hypothetical protein